MKFQPTSAIFLDDFTGVIVRASTTFLATLMPILTAFSILVAVAN
jgi:hypothetical protein